MPASRYQLNQYCWHAPIYEILFDLYHRICILRGLRFTKLCYNGGLNVERFEALFSNGPKKWLAFR